MARDFLISIMIMSWIGTVLVGMVLFTFHSDINPYSKESRKLRRLLYVFVGVAFVLTCGVDSLNSSK